MNHLLSWPPQPSTLIAASILLGGIVWYVTGSTELAGLVGVGAAALLPDNTGVGGQIAAALDAVEKAVVPIKRAIVGFALAGAMVALSACTPATPTTTPALTKVTPASTCQAIANVQQDPAAKQQLDALDPTSSLGVVWADAQSGCRGATPVAGVDASWTQQVWAMVAQLAPVVLPKLVPLIVGLL